MPIKQSPQFVDYMQYHVAAVIQAKAERRNNKRMKE